MYKLWVRKGNEWVFVCVVDNEYCIPNEYQYKITDLNGNPNF